MMMMANLPLQLPDDAEQLSINGQFSIRRELRAIGSSEAPNRPRSISMCGIAVPLDRRGIAHLSSNRVVVMKSLRVRLGALVVSCVMIDLPPSYCQPPPTPQTSLQPFRPSTPGM
jgi:hypothetical protein